MTQDDNPNHSTRTRLPKRTASNGGNAVARRPVGRPSLGEANDRYHGDLESYCGSEIERLVMLAAENKYRARLRFEQSRTEKRIDRLLGNPEPEEEE